METYKTKSQLWNKIGAIQQAGCKVEGDVRKVLKNPKSEKESHNYIL